MPLEILLTVPLDTPHLSPSCVVAHRPVINTSSRFINGVFSAHRYSGVANEPKYIYCRGEKY